jgi:two-component system sensor histidine kinase TctE
LAALGVQLESALRESRPEGQGDLLRQALASLDRTTRLSNQLLLLARAESDAGLAVRHARLDLRQIAFEAGASWVPKALQQGADLGLEGPDGEVPLLGDALLLAEVVNNLIDNALRYAGEKPRITLCVQANLPGQGPMLWVEDNGPGIPPEERDAVFERFHRVAGSPSAGSGLGLAIVKEIARAHGAEVFVDQASTGGMRVGLKFPALEM